jgi:hypothetical protein
MCTHFMIPAKIYFLSNFSYDLRLEQTLIRKTAITIVLSMNVNKISLHIKTRNVLRPSAIFMLQRSKPGVFQISKPGG